MNKKRSFTTLKKQLTYEAFCNFAKKIAQSYADSDCQFARSYYTDRYEISQSCFYRLIEFAVVTNLVDEKTFDKMKKKAMANQKAHASDAGTSTMVRYSKMYQKRSEYIANSFSNEDIVKFATDFADNSDITKMDLAAAYGISTRVVDLILVRGIEDNIIDDKTLDRIEERSINNSKDPQRKKYVKTFFDGLRKKRFANSVGLSLE